MTRLVIVCLAFIHKYSRCLTNQPHLSFLFGAIDHVFLEFPPFFHTPVLLSIKNDRSQQQRNSIRVTWTRPNRDESSSSKFSHYLNSTFRISKSSNDPIVNPRPKSSGRVGSSKTQGESAYFTPAVLWQSQTQNAGKCNSLKFVSETALCCTSQKSVLVKEPMALAQVRESGDQKLAHSWLSLS
jgi:hypothetical protein